MRPIKLTNTTVFRLAIRNALLSAALMFGLMLAIFAAARAQLRAQIDTGLRAEVAALSALYSDQGLDALERVVAARSTPAELRASDAEDAGLRHYLLADKSGKRLAGDLRRWPQAIQSQRGWVSLAADADPAAYRLDPDDRRHRIRAYGITLPDGDRLLVGQALNETDELVRDIFIWTLLAGTGGLLLSVGIGAGLGRRVVRRLADTTRAADAIMAGDLSRRLSIPGDDEFAALGARFDSLLDRLERLMQSTRAVTEDVAHDLRTPLGRLRSRLEVTLLERRSEDDYRETMTAAIDDIDKLLATFDAMLRISQLEAGKRSIAAKPIALASFCEDLGELYQPLAEERGLTLELDAPAQAATGRGDAQLLSQALSNLLENALKYTPSPGRVVLAWGADGDQVWFEVRDTGPGIAEADKTRVVERLVRLDRARTQPGSGLGLSLVQVIARLHGGRLELGDADPGLRARIVIPA